jgi:hypothetical protein
MDLILDLAISQFNFDSTELLAVLAIAMFVFRALGNYIPDDATGILGVVRKLAKILGLYVANRVTRGVDANEIAAASMRIAQVAKDAKGQ